MKKILITGGGGFIGSNLSLKLVDLGYDVTVIDNYSEQIHGTDHKNSSLYKSIADKVRILETTILNRDLMLSLVKSNEILVHYAAETGTGQSMYDIYKYSNVNIQGTALLLDLITNEENTISKIVVASSRSIYGEGKYHCETDGIVYPTARDGKDMDNGDFDVKCPICHNSVELLFTDESSKIHPSSVYGITKQVQEQLISLIGKSKGIPTVGLRYQNVYGPGQSLQNPYTGILSIFSTRILNQNSINIFEDGKESRDFIYIDDVVDATILAIESERSDNDIYNVGSGVGTSVIEVAEHLYSNYNVTPDYSVTGNYRLGDIRHNIADMQKIKSALAFKPKVSFEKGIQQFCDWVNSQEVMEDKYDQSVIEMKNKGLLK